MVRPYHSMRIYLEIIDTTFYRGVSMNINNVVSLNDTSVSFNEGLLRNILQLNPNKQFELVDQLEIVTTFDKNE